MALPLPPLKHYPLLSEQFMNYQGHRTRVIRPVRHLFLDDGIHKHDPDADVVAQVTICWAMHGLTCLQSVHSLVSAFELLRLAGIVHKEAIWKSSEYGCRRARARGNTRDALLLTGDLLFVTAFGEVAATANPGLVGAFTGAVHHMAAGEMSSALKSSPAAHTCEEVLSRIHRTTANLLSLACGASAALEQAPTRHADAAHGYGLEFGMALGLLRDLESASSKGHIQDAGTRWAHSLPHPVAIALNTNPGLRKHLGRAARMRQPVPQHVVEKIVQAIDSSGAMHMTLGILKEHLRAARQHLATATLMRECASFLCDALVNLDESARSYV